MSGNLRIACQFCGAPADERCHVRLTGRPCRTHERRKTRVTPAGMAPVLTAVMDQKHADEGRIMGLDVQIWARGKFTAEQVETCRTLFKERLPGFAESLTAYGDLVVLDTMGRYYGPGYERGHWPTIYAAVVLMAESFPGATVSYSSDEWDIDDGDRPATADTMQAIWRHWCGPHGDDYHKETRP